MDFVEFSHHRHDVVCNQTYGNGLPYSFHLKCVEAQVGLFKYLLDTNNEKAEAMDVAAGHDLLEDARMSYNDIIKFYHKRNNNRGRDAVGHGERVAESIFCCTESTGRNRKERHDQAFYDRLKSNKISVFVKLCDIIANIKFAMLMGTMHIEIYRGEFPEVKEQLSEYTEVFDPMFELIEKLVKK